MPKTKEFTNFERASVVNLRKNGLSFRKIGAAVGCRHSSVIRICKRYEKSGYPDKLERRGQPNKFDVRGERYVCRLSKKHRFSNLKTIRNELFSTHLEGNLSKWTVKRILKKYGMRNYARKRKPFVSFQNRKARVRWGSAVQDWQVDEWKDVIFSDKCRFGLKNDNKTLQVWRRKQEANDPTLFQQTFKNAFDVLGVYWAYWRW